MFVSDPRMLMYPLMKSPFSTMSIMAIYLLFVLKWGPEFMKDRKPFKINGIIQVYNAVQVILCLYLVQQSIQYCYSKGYSLLCEPVDYSTTPRALNIARGAYFYYLLKILDLLDTVFFVLRKKQNQVTFLHVYHHAGMLALVWHGIKYFAGGHSVFFGAINSFVHMVMYSYYLVTSLKPEYKNNIWWKKHITQLQIIQFLLIICHFLVLCVQPKCQYPVFPALVIIPQNVFMLLLFTDFYRKTYLKKEIK